MRADEAAGLLELAGFELDDDGIMALLAADGGLAGGAVSRGTRPAGPAGQAPGSQRFGGDDRLVVDFVRDELLSQLAPEEMSFLTHTSVLDRLAGPVCDAVLGRTDGATALSAMSPMNLLLVPLDRRDEWYRYHPLLADVLRAELRLHEPEAEAGLHAARARGSRTTAIPTGRSTMRSSRRHAQRRRPAVGSYPRRLHPARSVGRRGGVAGSLQRRAGRRASPRWLCVAATIGLVTGDGNGLRYWAQEAGVALRREGAAERAGSSRRA